MKLREFTGIGSLPEFLHRLSVCAKHNESSKLEKANHLSCALVGEAAQILWGHEVWSVRFGRRDYRTTE